MSPILLCTNFSNHFICAPSVLKNLVFAVMLRHSYIPQCLLDCVLHNPGKDLSDSDNYRDIALAIFLNGVNKLVPRHHSALFLRVHVEKSWVGPGDEANLCTGMLLRVIPFLMHQKHLIELITT